MRCSVILMGFIDSHVQLHTLVIELFHQTIVSHMKLDYGIIICAIARA